MTFDVYVTRDDRVDVVGYRMGLEPLFEDPGVKVTILEERDYHTLRSGDLEGANAVVSLEDLITEETLQGLTDLQVVARFGSGLDNLDIGTCTERGIAVMNAPQGPRRSVAQSALGMLLVCASNLLEQHDDLQERGFDRRFANMGRHLYEKRLGIVGFGQIGTTVCELVEPFEMDVAVHDPYVEAAVFDEYGVDAVPLEELLRTSDFVTIHCALTGETRGMLGRDEFDSMKETAYLVNTARGGICRDEKLAAAIRDGRIVGAAVDVFEDEPHVDDNPLLDLDGVVTTPHSAGVLREGLADIGHLISESLLAVRDDEVPNNVVNPEIYGDVPDDKLSPTHSATAVGAHYRD